MQKATVESFTVSGSGVRANNAQEDTGNRKLPALWARFCHSHPALSQTVYGVYSDYESDASGWAFFAKDQPYERLYGTDFEAYDGPASAAIFIGVKARS